MSRFRAIALWPLVFILDAVIGLIGKQTFKESRRISNVRFNKIMTREKASIITSDKHSK